MTEETFPDQDEKDKMEEEPLLREEKPFRIEPGEVKSVPEDIPLVPPVIEPKKPTEISLKEMLEKKEEVVVSPVPGQAKVEILPKTEGKSSPFFSSLFILSFIFMATALGLLLLPFLNIPIPPFLNSIINFIVLK
ncbi:hypothetical protein LR003_00610 [candidate division NPL-UPA2 bacterium]|nr:hypothetical protein [candidate division NPL-UPA2 bacterium]